MAFLDRNPTRFTADACQQPRQAEIVVLVLCAFLPADVIARLSYFPAAQCVAELAAETLHRPLRLAEAAAAANMHPNALSRYFSEKIGVRFSVFVMAVRAARAIALLETGSYGVAEVAAELGYDDVGAFSRAFKRMAGVSPSAYKARSPVRGRVRCR